MFKLKQVAAVAAFSMIAASAMASNFRSADQVYVPVGGHIASAAATFISDVWIANMSTTDAVDVSVIYTPNGQNPTSQYFDKAFVLQPNERREFVDFFAQAPFNLTSAFGSLVFNACKQGADCVNTQDAQGNSPNFRNIIVESRIYSIPAGQTNPAGQPTNGQDMPGIPWYNFASQRQSTNGLGRVDILGIRNTGTSGQTGTYRGNIGLLNASQFSTTTIVAKLYNGSTRTQIGSDYTITLGPLGFVQPSVAAMFGAAFPSGPTATNAYVTVEQTNSSPTADAPQGCLPDGCPGFIAYGSVLDNATQDATTLEAVYEKALTEIPNALDAIYGTASTGLKSNIRRSVGRH